MPAAETDQLPHERGHYQLSLNLGPGGGDQADLSQASERIGVAPAQVTQVTWAGSTTTGAGCSVPAASLILSS